VGTAVPYEVHHLVSAANKDKALQEALPLVMPSLHDLVRDTSITVVEGQYEYDITSLGLWKNTPFEVLIEQDTSVSDYPYEPLWGWNWDGVFDGKLRFPYTMTAGRKLLIVGIKPLAFSGSPSQVAVDSPQTLIIQAQAAQWLYERLLPNEPGQDLQRWAQLAQKWAGITAQRAAAFGMPLPPGTVHFMTDSKRAWR
jgi:hypothetical protein